MPRSYDHRTDRQRVIDHFHRIGGPDADRFEKPLRQILKDLDLREDEELWDLVCELWHDYNVAPDEDEACPGCGCLPGKGLTPSCSHPEGCGYFRGL